MVAMDCPYEEATELHSSTNEKFTFKHTLIFVHNTFIPQSLILQLNHTVSTYINHFDYCITNVDKNVFPNKKDINRLK